MTAYFVPGLGNPYYTVSRGHGGICKDEKDKNFFISLAFFVKLMHPEKTGVKNLEK
jgi:hypothetical protein